FIQLKHLKGPVTDPSAVIPPAGCTILHRRRCPYGEGSTSAIQPLSFATPSMSMPPCFSCRDTAGKSARLRVESCCQYLGSTRIRLITRRPSLFPTPIPAPPLGGLTAFLPSKKERYGLTTFRKVDTNG